MTSVSIDELLHLTRQLSQKLNGLRSHNIVNSDVQHNVYQKNDNGSQWVDLLMLGIDDASCTAQLIIQMQIYESDRQRAKMQVQRLTAENKWLRDELSNCRERLVESEQERAKLEVQIEHYKFKEELEQGCGNDSGADDLSINSWNGKDSLNLNKNLSESTISMNTSIEFNDPPTNSTACGSNSEIGYTEISPKLKTLHNLVIHYASKHRYDVAVPLCMQTLDDLERTIGRMHPDVATMLNILALVYRDQNKYSEAVHLLREALTIREHFYGEESTAVAATLNNLAVLQGRSKKYKEAELLFERALAIRIKKLGSDHPDVAKQLINLALVRLNQNKFEDTFDHYQKAISIYTNCFGVGDNIVIRTKISLASALIKSSRYADAEKILQEMIAFASSKSTENCDEKQLKIDSQLLLSAAKATSSLFRQTSRVDLADKIDSMINAGPVRSKELCSLLQTHLGDAGKNAGLISLSKLRAVIRICASSVLHDNSHN